MTNKLPDPVTEENLPESTSMSGKNAYYHYCETWDGRQSYAVCRHALAKYDEGKLHESSPCYGAIKNKSCAAIAMRKAEQVSGLSLYYVDRTKMMEENKARTALRETLKPQRQMTGGISSSLTEKGGIKPARLDIITGHKGEKHDFDKLIEEGSNVMKKAISNVNHEVKE